MVLIIVGFIVGIVVTLIRAREYGIDGEDVIIAFLNAFMGSFVALIIWVVIGGAIGFALPKVDNTDEKQIYTLVDNTTTSGKNYLFAGYINEEFVYQYIVETEHGKHIETVSAKQVYIQEGDYEPKMVTYTYKFKKKWYSLFAFNWNRSSKTIFYVPTGTVTREYNIDLK